MTSFPVLDPSSSLRIPVALISLDDQTQRRDKLRKRGIPNNWVENYFSATDMRSTKEDVVAKFGDLAALSNRYRGGMKPTDIGCAYSHRSAVKSLFESTDCDMFLVLEDDFVPHNENFVSDTMSVARFLYPLAKRNDAFVCLLGTRKVDYQKIYKRHVISKKSLPSDVGIFLSTSTNQYIAGAHAYLISRSAAKQTYDVEQKICSLADDWGYRKTVGLIKHLFFCYPDIIKQDLEVASTIDGPQAINIEKQHESLSQVAIRWAVKAPLNRLRWSKDTLISRVSSPFQFRIPDK